MRCRRREQEIILYLSGELSPQKEKELKSHLEACAVCRRKLAKIESFLNHLREIDRQAASEACRAFDWEKSWQAIDKALAWAQILGQDGREVKRQEMTSLEFLPPQKLATWRRLFLLPRWAYATVALLLTFLGGVLFGRFWPFNPPPAPTAPMWVERVAPASLQEHLEELRPLLLSIANLDEDQMASLYLNPDFVRSLMLENILLKHLLRDRDPAAAALLADLEIILRELFHLDTFDKQTLLCVKNFIKENGILFQIDILRKLSKDGG